MKITKVEATPINVPIKIDVLDLKKETNLSVCLVRIETDEGHQGFGITGITEEEVISTIVNQVAASALIGEDPIESEKLWHKLYWILTPRGQTGYAAHAMAAIDIACGISKARR